MMACASLLSLLMIDAHAYVSPGFNGYTQGRTYNTTEYYKIAFKTNHLGRYEVAIDAYEIPSNEWLPIIDSSYFKTDSLSVSTEVDNIAPSATYSAQGIIKVDVVFATGELSQSQAMQDYMDTFEAQLNASVNNIDAYVEKVETSTIDISSMSAEEILNTWINFPGSQYGGNYQAGWRASNGVLYTTENVNFTGFYSDLYLSITDGIYEFSMLEVGTGDPQGWTFRLSKTGETYKFYALEVNEMFDRVNLVRIDSWRPGRYATHGGPIYHGMINGQDGTYRGGTGQATSNQGAVGEVLATRNVSSPLGKYKIENTGNNIKVYKDNVLLIDYTDTSSRAIPNGAFGPYTCSEPNARFGDIVVTLGATKTMGEAISDVAWRDGSIRFVVHATDIIPQECDPSNESMEEDYAYTVAKLLNANCYLINLGNNSNKTALGKLVEAIREADDTVKGTFIHNKNPNITVAMDKSADYIIEIAKKFNKPVDWVLVNTEIKWNTIYKDSEKDPPLNLGEHNGRNAQPQDKSDIQLAIDYGLGNAGRTLQFKEEKILAEKWRYRHYNNFFDNSPIQVTYHMIWIEDPISIFEYPGKYRINYKRRDNPLYPNVSLEDAFDSYRYWSTDYDYRTSTD